MNQLELNAFSFQNPANMDRNFGPQGGWYLLDILKLCLS